MKFYPPWILDWADTQPYTNQERPVRTSLLALFAVALLAYFVITSL